MTRKYWLIALAVALVLTLGLVAFAQAAPQGGMKGPHGRGGQGPEMGMGFGPEMHFQKMVARLNLTPDQQEKIKSITKAQFDQNKGQRATVSAAHEALAKELFKDQSNPAEIQKQVSILQQDQTQRMAQWVQTAQEINKILTPDQRAEVQKMIVENKQVRENMREKMQQRRQQREQQKQAAPTPPPAQ